MKIYWDNARFAVTAPWGVEFNQDILGVIENNVLVVVSHNDSDWPIVLFGDSLALDGGLDLAGDKVINERADIFLGELLALVVRELLVLGNVLDGEGGPLVSLEVEVSGVGTERFGVNGSEVNSTLVFLSDRLEGGRELFALFGRLGEDVS